MSKTPREIKKLKGEQPAIASIKIERGIPRLFLNGREVYPLLAWSWGLEQSAEFFKQAGINLLHPILGMNAGWPQPEKYDWSQFDALFVRLLAKHPDAFFLPRILLDMPQWWKDKHPRELVKCALPTEPDDRKHYRPVRHSAEGGWLWGIQFKEPSLASEVWQADMEKLFCAFLQHIEGSPLRSRIFGYQIGAGIYGEWHYFLAEFLPDLSEPAQRKLGYVPDVEARLKTAFGLLRNPEAEKPVIEYFRRFHEEICADTLLRIARIVKAETNSRVICGAFYGYQLENVWMQEGGHLAPEKILASPDIDFIASPYSYQTTNIAGRPWWEHDIVDDSGHWLGRARGIAGDGGYRVLLESLKRHGKLYFVEMDANTYLEPPPINPDGSGGSDVEQELCMVGGLGSTTIEGSLRILQRDLGRMFVSGTAGWLFDFGPVLRTGKSWYAAQPLIDAVLQFARLGEMRQHLEMRSCAQIAAVYDAKSFFVTRHWRAEAPFPTGGKNLDYFSHWFMDSQARAFHRLGAPMDFLYRFDLKREDLRKYRLLFMMNLFYLTEDEVSSLREILQNSRAMVVWYYAPGFVTPDKLDLAPMERLTGFHFKIITEPGPMLIRCHLEHRDENLDMEFGVNQSRFPRFGVQDEEAIALGYWTDCREIAFALKKYDGWNSVYVGSAPVPVEILRWLANQAGADLWSTLPDIVVATEDAAMIVATSTGERKLSLPKPMAGLGSDEVRRQYDLKMEMGDLKIFTEAPIENF